VGVVVVEVAAKEQRGHVALAAATGGKRGKESSRVRRA